MQAAPTVGASGAAATLPGTHGSGPAPYPPAVGALPIPNALGRAA